jgi:hypothetical protein
MADFSPGLQVCGEWKIGRLDEVSAAIEARNGLYDEAPALVQAAMLHPFLDPVQGSFTLPKCEKQTGKGRSLPGRPSQRK